MVLIKNYIVNEKEVAYIKKEDYFYDNFIGEIKEPYSISIKMISGEEIFISYENGEERNLDWDKIKKIR